MSGNFVDPGPDRCWPLHPRPTEWEDLEMWVRRIAEVYGVSYDAFLLNALGHTGIGARDLDQAPRHVFAKLSAGTGVPVQSLRAMTIPRVMARMAQQIPEWGESSAGKAALDSLAAMTSRRLRRMSASRGF